MYNLFIICCALEVKLYIVTIFQVEDPLLDLTPPLSRKPSHSLVFGMSMGVVDALKNIIKEIYGIK